MSTPANISASNPAQLARALGWLSLALGVAALCAPRKVAQAVGAPGAHSVVRAVGARELASAAGLLARPDKPGWMWTRVAGDAMDLALLGTAMKPRSAHRKRLAIATLMIAGVTALDLWSSIRGSRAPRDAAAP